MADYISREAAIAELCRRFDNTDVKLFYPGVNNAVSFWLNSVPAADVVEVVRCKDCKLWCMTMPEDERKKAAENPWTDGVCELYESDGFSPNDFCSNARRREDE